MTLDQVFQFAQSPITGIVCTVILAVVISPWLAAHKAQVNAATVKIQNDTLRAAAQSAVRWVETDPAEAQLPGLVQREHGISALAKQLGINLGAAGPAIDDAYNLLTSTGQLVIAPKPATPAPDTTEATSVLDQLKALLAAASQPLSSEPPATSPILVPIQPQPSTGGAAAGSVVPISSTGVALGGVNVPGLPVGG